MGSTFARLLGVILWCAWGLGWAEAEMPSGLREALEQARHGIETEAGGYRAHNPRNAQQIAFREGVSRSPPPAQTPAGLGACSSSATAPPKTSKRCRPPKGRSREPVSNTAAVPSPNGTTTASSVSSRASPSMSPRPGLTAISCSP